MKKALKPTIVLLFLSIAILIYGGVSTMENAHAGGLTQSPVLVESGYPAENPIVADAIITDAPYNADKTGVQDATQALKDAIKDVGEAGGGTVYLPAGFYRISGSVTVDNYVTIAGDYRDPDTAEGDYGAVIVADLPFSAAASPGLFRMRGNSGAVGLTVWYPNQTPADVRPYSAAFEIMGGAFTILEHMQFTIKNVTLLNAFRGVAASRTVNPNVPAGRQDAHEGLVIENLKGTVLHYGVDSVNESDIGYFKNISFSPKYWAEAPAVFNPPEYDAVAAYTRANAVGLKLGDLEWSPYHDVSVEHCVTGVHIQDGTRIQPENPIDFMGGFYNLKVTDCSYGMVVDALYKGWGMLVTGGVLEGSVLAVENNSPEGYVRLTDVELRGSTAGERMYFNSAKVPVIDTRTPDIPAPANRLYDVVGEYGATGDGFADDTSSIVRALADASETGGVVYLRAGYYKVTSPLTIPAGVQLRGCSYVTNRDNLGYSAGTVIFSYYDDAAADAATAQAFITCKERAGVSGLRICYPENNLWLTGPGAYEISPSAFTIRLDGDGAYVLNAGLVNSYNGVHVKDADGCLVKNVPALFFNEGVRVESSDDCRIENVFSNATIATQTGFSTQFPDLFREGWLWRINSIWNYYTYTETHTKLYVAEDSRRLEILSSFTFCSAGFIKAANSSFTLIGCGGDRMYSEGSILDMTSCEATVVNQLKYHCVMMRLRDGGSTVNVYGRMNLHLAEKNEVKNESECNIVAGRMVEDRPIVPDVRVMPVVYAEVTEWKDGLPGKNPLRDILAQLK